MADIFREVDEELRREGAVKLWRRYGAFVIAIALAIVLAAAGYSLWQHYMAQQRLDRAQAYAAAVDAIGDDDEAAVQTLQELAAGEDGYAALARLQMAALQAEAGDEAAAVETYRQLADDADIEPALRNLAVILMASRSLDTAPPDELRQMLEPLAEAGNPWRFSAQELLGLLALRAGDTARAKEIYTILADDLEAPPSLRARAAELLASLQG